MTSSHENTRAANIAHFAQMIAILESFGSVYDPSNPLLVLTNLHNQLARQRMAETEHQVAKAAYSKAVDLQQQAFMDLSKLTTRIASAFKASGADALAMETLTTITRKIKGKRAVSKPVAQSTANGAPQHLTISAAQTGHADRISNFGLLVTTLQTHAGYAPNEPEIALAGLQAKLGSMNSAFQQVIEAEAELDRRRAMRNKLLKGGGEGLLEVAALVKAYIKSIFDSRSEQYKKIWGLSFRAVPN